ncbi:MAG TPA: HAMP domain-containing sensor histidine kinase, partial [Nitriliruptorales bacterium]
MTLRGRITLSATIAVALAVVLASAVVYLATAGALQREVDHDLTSIAGELRSGPANLIFQAIRRDGPRPGAQGGLSLDPRRDPFGGAVGYVQLLDSTGRVFLTTNAETVLPVSDDAAAVPLTRDETWETVTVDGRRIRVLTTPVGQAAALQVARPLDEVVSSLARLRRLLVGVGVVGIGAAAAIGWFVGRRAVRPVVELTNTAESVAATQDLSHRIDVDGNDELARLASTFNQMLASLEQARDAQDQLIADASHELRTPLTSLRTNIEVLSSGADLSVEDRQGLAADVVAQLDEFGQLVTGLVELARGDTPVTAMADVALDEIAEDVVARIRLRHPDADLEIVTAPTTVRGDATRIDRAIGNLVTNAIVHGGGTRVTVRVADRAVIVRDHGPGIPVEDLPHVTDRFHRSPDARS